MVQALTDQLFPDGAALQTLQGTTSYSIVLQPTGRDRMFLHHSGVNDLYRGDPADLGESEFLHVGYPALMMGLMEGGGQPLRELFSAARERGIVTSLDLSVVDRNSPASKLDWAQALRRLAPVTDVLSPSIEDLTSALPGALRPAPTTAEALAEELIAAGYGIVVITCGPDGMFLAASCRTRLDEAGGALEAMADQWADARQWIPAEPVTRVESTNGAGDTASAGLLAGIAAGLDPVKCGRFAASCAAARIADRPLPTPPGRTNAFATSDRSHNDC
jgi:sugar/nucleoside kinase (ribokinase family)